MSGFTQTEKNRTLGQAQNVQLGAFITPSGSGGSPTYMPQGYMKEDEPWGNAGRSLSGLGNLNKGFDKAMKDQAKAEEDAGLRQMDMDVYNIQVNPNMSASEKEIRVTDVYNQYPNLPASKKAAILSAHGANVENTQMFMSEHKKKQDVVQVESDQRKHYAELAVAADPYNQTLSPDEQYKRGKEYMSDVNKLNGQFQVMLYSDKNSQIYKDACDAGGEFMQRIVTTEFRDMAIKGKLTPVDIQAFKENFAYQLQQGRNPITGRSYSATEAMTLVNNVTDPMFQSMFELREKSLKMTTELGDMMRKDFVNKTVYRMGPKAVFEYELFKQSPEILKTVWGVGSNKEKYAEIIDNLYEKTFADAHDTLVFPRDTPNEVLCSITQNKDLPNVSRDASRELFTRQRDASQSPTTSMNLYEQIRNTPDYLNKWPEDLRQGQYELIKDAVAADFASNAQSLAVKTLDNVPEDAPWYSKIFAAGYNSFAGDGTYLSSVDNTVALGKNADAINQMTKDYMETLRIAGCTPQEATDVIKESLHRLGLDTKGFVPLSDQQVPYYVNLTLEGLMKPQEEEPQKDWVEKTNEWLAEKQKQGTVNEKQIAESISEQVESIQGNDGSVNLSSIYDTKQYKETVGRLANEVKNDRMTKEQATNELSVWLSNVKNALNKPIVSSETLNNVKDKAIGVVKELFGAKDAAAGELYDKHLSSNVTNTTAKEKAKYIAKNISTKTGLNPTVEILARTLFGEARKDFGGGPEEIRHNMTNVASVLQNRLKNFDTYEDVCLTPYAFECWNRQGGQYKKLVSTKPYGKNVLDKKAWDIAVEVANDLVNGKIKDTVNGAVFSIARGSKSKYVGNNRPSVAEDSGHLYFDADDNGLQPRKRKS